MLSHVVLVLGLGALLSGVAKAAPVVQFRVGPVSSWVQPLAVPPLSGKGPDATFLLLDQQARVRPDGDVERYVHWARHLATDGTLEDASHIEVSFDPSFQKLVWHGVWLVRGGKRLAMLRKEEVRLIQQEGELERRLYNGRMTAVLFLRDVRHGDILEVAFSLQGENPVFSGRFASGFSTKLSEPVVVWSERVLWPGHRQLHIRNHRTSIIPEVSPLPDGGVEYRWKQTQVSAAVGEDRLPRGQSFREWVQLTDFESWNDVARWASDLFVPTKGREMGLQHQARVLSDLAPDPAARFLAAVRFVQDDIRYLGIELGIHSHRPHFPGEVLANRYGDCKDKALLLVALLRAMHISADPALVNIDEGEDLPGWYPSPRAFDHVIVRAEIQGKTYWVDATATFERGSLDRRSSPLLGWALPVRSDTPDLERIPAAPMNGPTLDVEERYRVNPTTGLVTLEVLTQHHGEEANRIRRQLANGSRERLAGEYLNFYARHFPEARSATPLTTKDDAERNLLVVHESYELPGFWKGGDRELYAWVIDEVLPRPRVTHRLRPLGIRHPVWVRQVTRFDGPTAIDASPGSGELQSSAGVLTYDCRIDGHAAVFEYQYRSTASEVEAAQVPELLEQTERIRGALADVLPHKLRPISAREETRSHETWFVVGIGLCAIAALAIVLFDPRAIWKAWRGRARRRRFSAKLLASAGETPATALRLTARNLESRLRAIRCICGGPRDVSLAPRQEVRLGDELLSAVRWQCEACGSERQVYFQVQ